MSEIGGAALAKRFLGDEKAPLSSIHSWREYYAYFGRESDFEPAQATLIIAFYLASWGMFRGSSKLRNYHWKALSPVTDLARGARQSLRGISLQEAAEKIKEVFEFRDNLSVCLKLALPDVSRTDTLLSKISLGALGCLPAYDRFFRAGLLGDVNASKLNRPDFEALLSFTSKNGEFHIFCETVAAGKLNLDDGKPYPQMRLLDAYYNYRGRTLLSDRSSG